MHSEYPKAYTDACLMLVELAADGIDVCRYANDLRAAYDDYADTSNDERYKRALETLLRAYGRMLRYV
jgi:hypothetical protein